MPGSKGTFNDGVMMREILLGHRGPQKGKSKALVDDADYDWLMQWKWSVSRHGNTFYARRQVLAAEGKHRSVYMHREIARLKLEDGEGVDHINHNGLDNQRANLRVVTAQENQFNRRRVSKGYYWLKANRKWRAQIKVNYRTIHLGLVDDPNEAHQAHLRAKEKYHKIAS
jgi:hypothetical protein